MRNKKRKFYLIILPAILIIAVSIVVKIKWKTNTDEIIQQINPIKGSIENIVSTTGTVLPKNRLEIKPPVNGRIETILVKEGQQVEVGQVLAWMSSTERAAILDAAQKQSESELKYWQEVYKPIALIAPIKAEVIVATTQPGQTITTNDAVVVLSDKLIVRAQVDETDIGKIKLNQKAVVSLDAYPDNKIDAVVEHIYYESQTINNVTIYLVDLTPETIPYFFRSGMNATIDFIIESKNDVLLVPLEAVHKDREGSYVFVKQHGQAKPSRQVIKTGISDDKNVEIISGIDIDDKVLITSKKFVLPQANRGTNPFIPAGRQRGVPR